jgi:hypothetical protein
LLQRKHEDALAQKMIEQVDAAEKELIQLKQTEGGTDIDDDLEAAITDESGAAREMLARKLEEDRERFEAEMARIVAEQEQKKAELQAQQEQERLRLEEELAREGREYEEKLRAEQGWRLLSIYPAVKFGRRILYQDRYSLQPA